MKVYIVFEITETEYCGEEVRAVFVDEEDARTMVYNEQYEIDHWSGRTLNAWRYEEWEVE